MRASGQHTNAQTYHVLLDCLFKNKHFAETMTLFKEMEDKKLNHNIMVYNILIDGLCYVGKLARKFFYSIATKGLQHNVWTYNIIINDH